MYTVTQISEINTAKFDAMYEANKDQLVPNIGFDDLSIFKDSFTDPTRGDLKFQAVDDAGEVVAYFVGEPGSNGAAYMYNMITNASDTLPLTIESSANMLKSLGYTHVEFCVKHGSSTYTYTKNSMDRLDLYEYESETDIGNYFKTRLRLV